MFTPSTPRWAVPAAALLSTVGVAAAAMSVTGPSGAVPDRAVVPVPTQVAPSAAAATGVRTHVWRQHIEVPEIFDETLRMRNVAAGSYLGTMRMVIGGPDEGLVTCIVRTNASATPLLADSVDGAFGWYPINAAAVVTVTRPTDLFVLCASPMREQWSTKDGAPLQVSLTRIDRKTVHAFEDVPK